MSCPVLSDITILIAAGETIVTAQAGRNIYMVACMVATVAFIDDDEVSDKQFYVVRGEYLLHTRTFI